MNSFTTYNFGSTLDSLQTSLKTAQIKKKFIIKIFAHLRLDFNFISIDFKEQ